MMRSTALSAAPLRRRRFFVLSLAALLLAGISGSSAIAGEEDWVASWGAPPSDPVAAPSNQTVREIARVSLGGERVRIRLSNELGTAAVTLGAAHIARAGAGSAIVPGSDRTLTFSGEASIVIPPRALVYSDPVDLALPDLGSVAVSLYFPAGSSTVTTHQLGVQTAYIVSGDATAAASLTGASTSLFRYLLSEVQVVASGETAAVVTLGDSITDGYCSTVDANHRWPDFLAARVAGRLGVVNEAISGNRVLHDNFGPNALSRLDRDVLVHPGAAFVTVLEGINDIGLPGAFAPLSETVSADDIIAGYKQLIARAHAKGLRIYGATLTPFEGTTFPGYFTPAKEPIREAVNAWIRGSGGFDAVIDFDAVVRDPTHPTRILAAYDCGDHLHPNDAGYQAMANALDLTLFRGGQRRGD